MNRKFIINIDTSKYDAPTQEDLDAAKRYIVRRNNTTNALRDIAEEEIKDAAAEIAQIAMRYDTEPTAFAFDSNVSEDMMDEVAEVMDDLEETLMAQLVDYATMPARDDGIKYLLIALLLSLGHRNLGMRETVHQYLWRTLRQTEALVVAAKAAKMSPQVTVSLVRSSLSQFRGNKQYRALMRYRHLYNAQYVRNGGQATFSDGTPNVQGVPTSGLLATLNTLASAVDAVWMYNQQLEMQQDGAIGYWQFRGSDYPCDICDEEVGFHEIEQGADIGAWVEYEPYPHAHCCCGRMPIYSKQELENIS